MASIPGARFDITGTTGSSGALTPRDGWKAYVFPRGAYASADSTGTDITVDSSDTANRFAINNWVQVGLSTANIRRVTLVGAASIRVNSAVTVAENDRVYFIGNTQPTVSGGSATYTIPQSIIRQRDDDAADIYTNSMVTSNSDGLIQFFGGPAIFDVLIQDGNNGNQGSIIDLAVGAVEGVSTSMVSLFGATVTINANVGITGSLVLSGTLLVGQTSTVNGAFGATGWATFGASVTVAGALGVTGTLAVGATSTLSGSVVVGGTMTLGAGGIIGGVSVNTGIFGVSNQPRCWLVNSANQNVSSNTSYDITWNTEHYDVGGLHDAAGSSSTIVITQPGFYFFVGQVEWAAITGATGTTAIYEATIRKNNTTYEIAEVDAVAGQTGTILKQNLSGMDSAVAGDFYQLFVRQLSGTTQTITCTVGRLNTHFQAVKLF